MEGCDPGGLGTEFGRTLRVLEGVGLEPGVGEAPEWAGLGLGPESMGGVWLGTFWRLSLILKQVAWKGDSVIGRAWDFRADSLPHHPTMEQ